MKREKGIDPARASISRRIRCVSAALTARDPVPAAGDSGLLTSSRW